MSAPPLRRRQAAQGAPRPVRVEKAVGEVKWRNSTIGTSWSRVAGSTSEAMAAVPRRRMSEPEDIAGTVAWLLSPDARGVTGQAIDQNGG
ncbi:MAG: SDR family oxidoreductase, partial [Gaiellaceae bacterium]